MGMKMIPWPDTVDAYRCNSGHTLELREGVHTCHEGSIYPRQIAPMAER